MRPYDTIQLYGFLAIFSVLLSLSSCRKDDEIQPFEEEEVDEPITVSNDPVLPAEPYDYEGIIYPDYFLESLELYNFNTLDDGNQVTNEGATLGRVLFYDKNLSLNRSVSCASCHHQDHGFSDPDQFSTGFEGGLSDRNSMAIVNIDFQRRFFWDHRVNSIEQQVLMPIEHPVEMGMELDSVVKRLISLPYYKDLFADAFEDTTITITRAALALGQFLKSIRSFNSKYDQGIAVDFANFNETELAGKELFFSGEHSCVNCHRTPNFGGMEALINGLDETSVDPGVGAITGDDDDQGKFKSVTLRNIALTGPYMHDGRFETLEDVLDFYSTDVQAHPYLDDRLTTNFTIGGPPKDLNFTPEERAAYLAFLNTLTDWDLVNNPIYSNPFPE